MEAEELEFAISQLADGTLDESARPALERRLAADPAARKMLADYRAVDAALRAAPIPPVAWDKLAALIAGAIDTADEPVSPDERAVLRYDRHKSWRLSTLAWWIGAGAAMAAVLLFGIGIGVSIDQIRTFSASFTITPVAPSQVAVAPTAPSPKAPPAIAVAMVRGPAAEAAAGAAVADVSIGPSPSVAETNSGRSFADSVIYRPPGVIIGSGNISGQDDAETLPSLYQH